MGKAKWVFLFALAVLGLRAEEGADTNSVATNEARAPSAVRSALTNGRPYLVYDYHRLYLYDEKAKLKFSVHAESGQWPAWMDQPRFQNIRAWGPIPEGWYVFDPALWYHQNLKQGWSLLVKRKIDFGAHYVYLYNGPGNWTTRSALALHGGVLPGSSGCVDCLWNIEKVYQATKNWRGPVAFIVVDPGIEKSQWRITRWIKDWIHKKFGPK
ncbi:MAG: hypothetical protein JNM63_08045 [Spirochaetia bacterium]|nr:hypothetical protein [Spirochaetia bacterium]